MYSFALHIYWIIIRLVSLFKRKAKLFIEGRKHWKKDLIVFSHQNKKEFKIWIHAVSLGEFEQARPVISAIKKQYPNSKIICTFFSPSAYEIRKNYKDADCVMYLPLDTKKNAQFWVQTLQPNLVLWVKYDIWVNFLTQLKKANIHCILFSAIFRKKQLYFQPYGTFFLKGLKSFSHIFVQNEASVHLLQKYNIQNCSLAHDTRFDRVFNNAQQPEEITILQQFCEKQKTIIAGSTWAKDEALLTHFINTKKNNDWQLIIAPHEIKNNKIEQLIDNLSVKSILFSQLKYKNIIDNSIKVIIIDNIGLLSSIYQYGKLAYIGGGFGAGIHNILEAAIFDLPIIFGSNYQKFQEAKDLIAQNGAISINDITALEKAIHFFEHNKTHNRQYVLNRLGGTQEVLRKIEQFID